MIRKQKNIMKKISRKYAGNVCQSAALAVFNTPNSPKDIAEWLQPLIDRLSKAEAWDESETWNDDEAKGGE